MLPGRGTMNCWTYSVVRMTACFVRMITPGMCGRGCYCSQEEDGLLSPSYMVPRYEGTPEEGGASDARPQWQVATGAGAFQIRCSVCQKGGIATMGSMHDELGRVRSN